jgi:hypothetical protein
MRRIPRGNTHCEVGPSCPYVPIIDTNSYFDWAGLAETLRSELLLYDISVHIFFPGTIFTPGYTQENKTKPKITLKIEETDSGMTPEQSAAGLLRGMPSDLLSYCMLDILTPGSRRTRRTFSYICRLLGIGFSLLHTGIDTAQQCIHRRDLQFHWLGWCFRSSVAQHF